jgi:hypothetical protein
VSAFSVFRVCDEGEVSVNDVEHLNFQIGPLLEAKGGILDKLDYNRLRQLAVRLRNIPAVREDQDWDFPPANLQGWIKSYSAAVQAVRIASESGLLSIIGEKWEGTRVLLSPAIIPSFDAYVIGQENIECGKERVEQMIHHAKEYTGFTNFDFEKFSSNTASSEAIARVLVVTLGASVRWDERPKVDKNIGVKRLQIGALIGKAAAGGALVVTNLSVGALAALSVLPALGGNVPFALGIVGSACTGLATACDAIEKIASAVR